MEVREVLIPAKEDVAVPADSSTPSPSSGVIQQGIDIGMAMGIESGELLARKKRGRPRKYGPDGSMALALLPAFPPSSGELSVQRKRGRPPGSGNRQMLASFGEWLATSAGGNFIPHVVTIAAGEDVAMRILSFSQKGPRSVCILSANGAVSNVTLRQPGSSGGTLTYEGRFEILSLTGSFTPTETGGVRSRTGGISVSLAGPDGRVIGGGVAGLLQAASPIQVIVGSFMPYTNKEPKRRPNSEPPILPGMPISPGMVGDVKPISQVAAEEISMTPNSTPSMQNHVFGNFMPYGPKDYKRTQNSEPQVLPAISVAGPMMGESRPISQAMTDKTTCLTPGATLSMQSHGVGENGSGVNQNSNSLYQ